MESKNLGNNIMGIADLLRLERNGKTHSTINRCIASVKSFYKFMKISGIQTNDPTENLHSVKTQRKFPEMGYPGAGRISEGGFLLQGPHFLPESPSFSSADHPGSGVAYRTSHW